MQQRHDLRRAQARQRRFELQRLVNRLANELFDDRLAPRTERALAESATESLHARDADAEHLACVAVEHHETGFDEDLGHFVGFTRFHVVVAQHGRNRNSQRGEFLRQNAGLFRQTVVSEIARQQQQIRRLCNAGEQRLKRSLRGFTAVKVRERGHADDVLSHSGRFITRVKPNRSRLSCRRPAACTLSARG